MQINAQHIHGTKHPGQNKRYTACHNKAGPKAQAQEAYRQHDDDGLTQRAHKIADGFPDHTWLIRNLMDFQTSRHVHPDLCNHILQIVAKRQNIAARLHRYPDADCRLPVIIHFRICRLHISALHLRDIPETENPPIRRNRHIPDCIYIRKRTRNAHIDIIRRGLDHAGRRHLILRFECIGNNLRTYAKLCQAGILDFHIDLFRLLSQKLDLLHIRDGKQQPTGLFCLLTHFLIGIAIPCHGIDGAIDIIETVIVIRTIDALRQILPDILAEIPHILPGRTNLRIIHILAQRHINNGCAFLGITLDIIQPRCILQLFLQFVRDLLLHLICSRARPGHGHDHLTDSELRVLHTAQLNVGKNAANKDHEDKIPHQTFIF